MDGIELLPVKQSINDGKKKEKIFNVNNKSNNNIDTKEHFNCNSINNSNNSISNKSNNNSNNNPNNNPNNNSNNSYKNSSNNNYNIIRNSKELINELSDEERENKALQDGGEEAEVVMRSRGWKMHQWINRKWQHINRKKLSMLRHEDDIDHMTLSLQKERKSNWRWVVVMMMLGTFDTLGGLVKAVVMSRSHQVLPRLKRGSVFYSGHLGELPHSLRLPLCFFTAISSILAVPEALNTLTACTRLNGSTIVPLHLELLLTLHLKYIPLALISYFTSRWRLSMPLEFIPAHGRVIELTTTSIRIMFVSLRIIWYSYVEGRKLRKNDKYEISQVMFLLACLLFSVTLAIPIMTTKLKKDVLVQERELSIKIGDNRLCGMSDNVSVIAAWEHQSHHSKLDESEDDDDEVIIWRTTTQTELLNLNYHSRGYLWKIHLSSSSLSPPPQSSSSPPSSSSSPHYLFQKRLRLSVCDLYNSKNQALLVEYTCPSTFSASSISGEDALPLSVSDKFNQVSFCLPEVDRLVFHFRYHSFYLQNETENRKEKQKVKKVEKNVFMDLLNERKENENNDDDDNDGDDEGGDDDDGGSDGDDEEVGYPGSDDVLVEVGTFCKNSPYLCYSVVFNGDGDENNDDDDEGSDDDGGDDDDEGGDKGDGDDGDAKQQNNHHHFTPPNFNFKFDQSEDIINNLFLEIIDNHHVMKNSEDHVIKNPEDHAMKDGDYMMKDGDHVMKDGDHVMKDGDHVMRDGDVPKEIHYDWKGGVCGVYSEAEDVDWSGDVRRFEKC